MHSVSVQKQIGHPLFSGCKDICYFGDFGLERLALLCKEVPGDVKAPRSHSFHYPRLLLCTDEMCSVSKDFSALIYLLPPAPCFCAGATRGYERAGLPPVCPRERAAPSAGSGCAGRWKLRPPGAGRGPDVTAAVATAPIRLPEKVLRGARVPSARTLPKLPDFLSRPGTVPASGKFAVSRGVESSRTLALSTLTS